MTDPMNLNVPETLHLMPLYWFSLARYTFQWHLPQIIGLVNLRGAAGV